MCKIRGTASPGAAGSGRRSPPPGNVKSFAVSRRAANTYDRPISPQRLGRQDDGEGTVAEWETPARTRAQGVPVAERLKVVTRQQRVLGPVCRGCQLCRE